MPIRGHRYDARHQAQRRRLVRERMIEARALLDDGLAERLPLEDAVWSASGALASAVVEVSKAALG